MAGNKKREDRRRGRNRPDILRNRERLLGSLSLSLSLSSPLSSASQAAISALFLAGFFQPCGELLSLPLSHCANPPSSSKREREREREGGRGRKRELVSAISARLLAARRALPPGLLSARSGEKTTREVAKKLETEDRLFASSAALLILFSLTPVFFSFPVTVRRHHLPSRFSAADLRDAKESSCRRGRE